jgi:hypothetical protein
MPDGREAAEAGARMCWHRDSVRTLPHLERFWYRTLRSADARFLAPDLEVT